MKSISSSSPQDPFRLYIANLPIDISEQDLHEQFSKYGHMNHCHVVRNHESKISRQFGFIGFTSNQSAIDLLSIHRQKPIHINGLLIQLKKAHPDKGPRISSEPEKEEKKKKEPLSPTLLLPSLSLLLSEQDVYTYFSKFGSIQSITMHLNSNSHIDCRVTFNSRDDLKECIKESCHRIQDIQVSIVDEHPIQPYETTILEPVPISISLRSSSIPHIPIHVERLAQVPSSQDRYRSHSQALSLLESVPRRREERDRDRDYQPRYPISRPLYPQPTYPSHPPPIYGYPLPPQHPTYPYPSQQPQPFYPPPGPYYPPTHSQPHIQYPHTPHYPHRPY